MSHLSLQDIQMALDDHLSQVLEKPRRSISFLLLREKSTVADSTIVFLLRSGKTQYVLQISPSEFPDVVETEQNKTALARVTFGNELGSVLLQPVAHGRILNQSYAVVPFCRGFSDSRLVWPLQRKWLTSHVIRWLDGLINLPVAILDPAIVASRYSQALSAIEGFSKADVEIRRAASHAQNRIETGKFRPRHVPMHGDFWKGNILHASAAHGTFPFSVIDWSGSETNGFPIFDLVRVAESFRIRANVLRSIVVRQTAALECDAIDAQSYLLAALGHVAMTLDQFPVQRFLSMASICLSHLRAAIR